MTDTDLKIHSHPGKPKGLRPKSNKPSIKFADHLMDGAMPTAPVVDPSAADLTKIDFNMDGNGPDSKFGANFEGAGDCVDAMTDHGLQVIDYLTTGKYMPWSVDLIKKVYATQNPKFTWDSNSKTGAGSAADGGMDIQELLTWCTKNGLNGEPASDTNPPIILGFAEVDYKNEAEFNAAIFLGLALWTGVNLQDAQMDQFDSGEPWTVVKGSPDDGGHGVPYVLYNPDQLVTWAKLQEAGEGYAKKRMTQCFFVITSNLAAHPNFRAGYDLESFGAAYEAITGKSFPAVTPAPVAPPTPAPDPAEGLALNITDPQVIQHILKAAGKTDLTTWGNHHFESYFKIQA